jgi:hypothetical protein
LGAVCSFICPVTQPNNEPKWMKDVEIHLVTKINKVEEYQISLISVHIGTRSDFRPLDDVICDVPILKNLALINWVRNPTAE